jgi:C_GCAxxG_C_C family probable redox protein
MKEKTMEAITEKASRLAAEYEKTCTGCAQSAVAGLADGIGLTGDGSCGALTGCAMVLGLVFGRERADHGDMLKPMQSYLLCKELYEDFAERYGSSRCHDIQQKIMGRTYDLLEPGAFEQALKDGMLEHCSQVVGSAVGKTAELILRDR